MSSNMQKHLMPTPLVKHQPYANDSQKYEGVKAKIDSQLLLVESCLGKCNANFKAGGLFGKKDE